MPAHSHSRGTQDITGSFGVYTHAVSGTGVFTISIFDGAEPQYNSTHRNLKTIHFTASRNWTGASQSIGSGTAHGHDWTGTSVTIDNNPPYKTVYCFYRIS